MQGVKSSGSRVGLCPEAQTLSTRNPGQVLHTKPYNPARSQPGSKTRMMTYFSRGLFKPGTMGIHFHKGGCEPGRKLTFWPFGDPFSGELPRNSFMLARLVWELQVGRFNPPRMYIVINDDVYWYQQHSDTQTPQP